LIQLISAVPSIEALYHFALQKKARIIPAKQCNGFSVVSVVCSCDGGLFTKALKKPPENSIDLIEQLYGALIEHFFSEEKKKKEKASKKEAVRNKKQEEDIATQEEKHREGKEKTEREDLLSYGR
jgi:pyruvate/2-oxoacid:ferredoxin oxidoreductase beta subunit